MKIYKVYNKQNLIKIFLFIVVLFLLLSFSKQNFESVKRSLELFINSVFPSLFPFFLFTELIINSNIIDILVQYFGNIISKIFKTNKNATPAIIIGFLCGYPMGAKIVIELYEKNKISKAEASKLLSFVNNCNPVFIISTVGISILRSKELGIILFISHFLSAFLIGLFSNIFKTSTTNKFKNITTCLQQEPIKTPNFSFFNTLKKSITKAFITLSNILGFIIIFNLLFDNLSIFLKTINTNTLLTSFIAGIFEVTRGTKEIASVNISLNLKLSIISFLLGFSGICILCQIYSCIYTHKFKFKTLATFKLLQGVLSFFITYLVLNFIDTKNIQVFGNIANSSYYLTSIKHTYIFLAFTLLLFLSLFVLLYTLHHKNSST